MKNVLNEKKKLGNDTTAPANLSESVYKFSANVKAQDSRNGTDGLVVWKTDEIDQTTAVGRCKANCDIEFDQHGQGQREWQQRSMSVEELDEKYQCPCIETINKLKEIFELSDQEIDFPRPARNTFPEDLAVVAFDSDDDEVGDNLDLCDFDDSTEQCSDRSDMSMACDSEDRYGECLTSRVEIKNDSSERLGQTFAANNAKPSPAQETVVDENLMNPFEPSVGQTKPFDDKPIIKHIREKPGKNSSTTLAKTKKRFKCCMELDSVDVMPTKKNPKEVKYVYTYGDDYRRVRQFGHKGCVQCWSPIPKNKSWITAKFAYRDLSKCHKLNRPEQNKNEEKQIADINMVDDRVQVLENVELEEQPSNVTVVTKTSGTDKKKNNPKPTLVLNKENGVYTIAMNFLTADNTISPTVFKLGECPDAENISSSSSFDVELITPKIFNMMHDKYSRKDKSTIYRPEDLTEKKKTVRSVRQQPSQHSPTE